MSFDMLAILGRGIQRLDATAPVGKTSSWVPTEDLEVCDKNSAHLPVRVAVDDENSYCMIGGGSMNLSAGIELMYGFQPLKILVCAYGGRSKYLESIGGPSESEVMSAAFMLAVQVEIDTSCWPKYFPEIIVWPRTHRLPVPSNTRQELLNIFDLALERGLQRIALVTVGVHIPRTATYIAKHLSVYGKYRKLSPVLLESEEVLLGANRGLYGPRVEALRNSQAFARNWEREADGIQKIVRDSYGDAKPKVVAA